MNSLFKVHKLNEDGMKKAVKLATEFDNLLTNIDALLPPSRETSLFKTHLELASFYAKKAMAQQPENTI